MPKELSTVWAVSLPKTPFAGKNCTKKRVQTPASPSPTERFARVSCFIVEASIARPRGLCGFRREGNAPRRLPAGQTRPTSANAEVAPTARRRCVQTIKMAAASGRPTTPQQTRANPGEPSPMRGMDICFAKSNAPKAQTDEVIAENGSCIQINDLYRLFLRLRRSGQSGRPVPTTRSVQAPCPCVGDGLRTSRRDPYKLRKGPLV